MEKAGGLEALRPGGAAGRLIHGAAGRRVRDVRDTFVGRDGVLGFAFTDDGQLGLAGGAVVLRQFLGGGSSEDLATLGLRIHCGREDVGTFGTGHGRRSGDGRCSGGLALV